MLVRDAPQHLGDPSVRCGGWLGSFGGRRGSRGGSDWGLNGWRFFHGRRFDRRWCLRHGGLFEKGRLVYFLP
jgi:hypothetical protein